MDLSDCNLNWYDIKKPPFKIYGISYSKEEKKFIRVPNSIAKNVSEKVETLSTNTSGGRVRFATTSRRIALSVKYSSLNVVPTMPLVATSGFDIYIESKEKTEYLGIFKPHPENLYGYESMIELPDSIEDGLNYFTVNFPIRNEVQDVRIGIDNGATIEKGYEYKNILPIVYYGSSITQGASASRPGTTYESIICRNNNCDYYNFGFSGAALGEKAIADYLSGLDMSIFVCDYDHNSPNAEELKVTHRALYKTIRKNHPDLPYVMITRPDGYKNMPDTEKRRKAIYDNYSEAVSNGDKNVYFIDGNQIFSKIHYSNCTLDTVHPNDLGFWLMAERIGETVNNLLNGKF